jgi:Ni,Fe-hydrogenase maturation factor
LSEALTLGRVFQDLPPWLIIYGIEGRNFELGEHLSPEVAAAIPEAARRLKLEILAWLGREDPETISLE